MSENMELINEIVCGVMDTPMWGKIATEDPRIKAAQAEVSTMLARYCPTLPKQQRGKIEDAICEVGSAYTDAAFLYGMHIAQALQAAAANPSEYSAYVLSLTRGRAAV